MDILNLKDATSTSGGKAAGLSLLNKIGVPVPAGFVINKTLDLTFNEKDKKQLSNYLSKLDSNKKLAVRSSACAEDGVEKSFAGIFETKLNVSNDIDSVIDAIKYVNKSASTDVVKSYSNGDKQKMNIVVQEMVTPKIAGVLFTNAIDINGDDVVLIEVVEGLADKLVSGSAKPAEVIAKINDNKISPSCIRVEGSLIDLGCLKNIFKYVNKIKKDVDMPLDIEWCIDLDGNPYFVQARPITSTVFINKQTTNSGIIASRGYAEAETYVIDENKSDEEIEQAIKNFKEGSILVAGVTETLYMPAIKKAKGIITEEGSALSHAAIVSRELGIPCIAGYKDAISSFPTGTKIILDASNGKIISNGIENNINSKKSFEYGELYCFDNTIKVNFNDTVVFFEYTPGGIMLHMASDDATPKKMEEIERFARKNFNCTPEQHFDDKNLWYLEIERFKKLPFFNELCNEMHYIVMEKDIKKLDEFYDKNLQMLSDLVWYKNNKSNNLKEKLIIDEIGAAINLILDAMLPLGYALRECYMSSMEDLNKNNITINDLLSMDINDLKEEKLIKLKMFLDEVAINRNEVYEKICDIGATSPEYFENREKYIELATNGQTDDIDLFYNLISEDDLINIKNIMQEYFKKKINEKVMPIEYEKKL